MTKRMIALVLLGVALAVGVSAQAVQIAVPGDFADIEDFIAFRDEVASTPEGGAAVFVAAMLLYELHEEIAEAAMVVALDRELLAADATGYAGFAPARSVQDFVDRYLIPRPYIARSYILETDPEDAYALPDEWVLGITRNRFSVIDENTIKVFVASSGAATPRPITLRRNNRGVWKAHEFSSLFVGVVPPVETVDDAI